MNAECPDVGGHSTMNHHYAVTNKRMNLILSARAVYPVISNDDVVTANVKFAVYEIQADVIASNLY
ncbi:unnamed protein product [Wuchereria bancrofti]|uniref:Uncharacterized protein n=1 Tax=Wuchereria bancrofti TaxID=6293 RepID=A0A3P7EFS3_WUCBA|nr:unnamed protein product [Wuchereria bancrofti]